MDPLKYLIEKPVQDGKTAKWVLLLSEYDIKYVTQKSVKVKAITDHLAHCSLEQAEEIQGDFPDEDIKRIEVESWKMYFDGVTNQNGSVIGGLLISPKGAHIPFSSRINFPATNNVTKYEACIMGLQAALGLGVKELEVYGDSALIISQIQNKWKIKEERLMPYHECLQKWASKFTKIRYQYMPRIQNQITDALATMESMMDGPKEDEARPIVLEQKEEPAYYMTIEENEEKNREGAIPYSLMYGMEAVLHIEMGVCSLRTVLESEIPEADWLQSRYDQLCMLDEKGLKALYHIQGY
ncbi:uncharacterized protein LOC142605843 [Castanea sativa]|uniref:uncharacterized protein LOC142605843 n=1 Tax=Castanea sativa TaxID=21020 RepID=UPI003F65277C